MKRAVLRGILPLVALGAFAAPGVAHAQERALEVVSPAESKGNEMTSLQSQGIAAGSLDGDHAYYLDEGFPLDFKLSTRTATGWTTRQIDGRLKGDNVDVADTSADMSTVIWGERSPYGQPTDREGIFVLHDGDQVETVATWTVANYDERAVYLASSEDRRQLLLRAAPSIFPEAVSNSGLYRWTVGSGVQPINVDWSRYTGATCSDPRATVATPGSGMSGVSQDGNTVVLTTPACTKSGAPVASHLVRWRAGTSEDITVPVPGGADGNATFVGMNGDASRVFFTTTAKLESTDANGAADLYVWEDGHLRRLTDGNLSAKQVQASKDGSTVWFQTDQPLAGMGQAGKANLFAWDGDLDLVGSYLAPLGPGSPVRGPFLYEFGYYNLSQLSKDGSALVYGNDYDPVTGVRHPSVQAWRIGRDGQVDCISCSTTGEVNQRAILPIGPIGEMRATWVPAISEDGSIVAFETATALDPRDSNGLNDTYMWKDGRTTLISSGTEPTQGNARGMTPDGSSIFFTQGGPLAPGVTDTYQKLWVSRVGGGFAVDRTPDPCGIACQGPLTPTPDLPVAATVAFSGPGNLVEAPAKSSAPTVTKPKTARGTSTVIRVKVPGAGSIRITGSQVGTAKRTVAKGGSYQLRVRLTKKAQRSLAKKSVTAALKVRFTPAEGDAASRSVKVRFAKKASSRKAAR